MPLPLTVSCFSKIQIGFTFLVPAHLGSSGQRAVKWVCVPVWHYVSMGTSYGPVSVSMSSVTSWCSIEMAEPIGLVFSMGVSFQLSYSVLCVCYPRLLTIMWPCVLQSTINYWCRCKHYRHVINTAEEGLKRYANDPLLKFIVAFGMMREGSNTYIAMPNVLNCYIK